MREIRYKLYNGDMSKYHKVLRENDIKYNVIHGIDRFYYEEFVIKPRNKEEEDIVINLFGV